MNVFVVRVEAAPQAVNEDEDIALERAVFRRAFVCVRRIRSGGGVAWRCSVGRR